VKKLLLILIILISVPFIGLGQIKVVTDYSIIKISNGQSVNERDNNYYAINISWYETLGHGSVYISKNSTSSFKGNNRWDFDLIHKYVDSNGNLKYQSKVEGGLYYTFTVDNNSSVQKIIECKIFNKRIVKKIVHYIR